MTTIHRIQSGDSITINSKSVKTILALVAKSKHRGITMSDDIGAIAVAAGAGMLGAYVLYRVIKGRPISIDKWESRMRRAMASAFWRNRANNSATATTPKPPLHQFDPKDYPLTGQPYVTDNNTLVVPDRTSGLVFPHTPRGMHDMIQHERKQAQLGIKGRPGLHHIMDNY